jgi:hypothetical protein
LARRSPVNEIASNDPWPLVAETLSPKRFQSTGRTGFNMFPIVDRMFPYDHGGAIRQDHINKWILPIIATGAVKRNEIIDQGYLKHIPTYARRFIFFIVFIILVVLYYIFT